MVEESGSSSLSFLYVLVLPTALRRASVRCRYGALSTPCCSDSRTGDTTEGLLSAAEGLLPDLARRLALVLDLLCTRQAAAARRVLDA